MLSRVSTLLGTFIGRHARSVLVIAIAITLAAVLPATRFRIETDLTALLPDGAPGADDYRVFLKTFGGFEKVFVMVRAPQEQLTDSGPLIDAAEQLAEVLRQSPEVAEARSGLTEEDERFFFHYVAPRLPLLQEDTAGLARRLEPAALHDRVATMREAMRSPAGTVAAKLFASDPLGLSEGLLAAASSALPMDPISGAFVSRQGDAALVILTPARAEIDPAGGRALLSELRRGYARVRKESGLRLEFRAIGGPLYAAQDEAILRGDLAQTSTTTLLGVALVLVLGFEGWLIPFVVLTAVVAGVAWTGALASLGLGTISVLGIGFAAALLGMGVDYGIHGTARFRDLRLLGEAPLAALLGAFREAGPGIATAALTTAAALAALNVAHFRLLREMGWVLTVGVLSTFAATITLAASLMVTVRRLPSPPRLFRRFGTPALARLSGFAARRAPLVLAAALALSAFAGWGLARLDFSTDLRALRPADVPSAETERLLVEKFALGLDTFSVVVHGRDLSEALDRAAVVRRVVAARLGKAAEITTPSDWLILGERRRRRLAELRALPLTRAADDLRRELAAAGFNPQPFAPALATLRALGQGEDPGAPAEATWPRWMSELVRTGRGVPRGGAAVAVHVRAPLGASSGPLAEALARELQAALPGAPAADVALASIPRVGGELRQLALRDLALASVLAAVLVGAVVLISFHGKMKHALLSGLPLLLGCLWTFGLWGAAGRSLDLLCVFTVPLLLGTGINLGAHAVHWRRLHPERGLRGAVEDVGLAMILATLTTVVGFGSLATSRVPGLQSAGILVAVGLSGSLLTAFLVLPALEAVLDRRSGKRGDGVEEVRR